MTDLLLNSETTPTQREYLSTVLHSGESLLTIINEILDFSQIEAGKISLDTGPLNIRREVGEMMRTLAPRAAAKKLELSWHVDDDVPQVVEGDSFRLRQIMLNLVGNAIKFTESGGVTVTVVRQAFDEASVEIRFEISDTGIGIGPENVERIFEEFQQADTTTTRKYGGTGLGLTVSSRLVGLMGGRIGVESAVEEGSKFFFTIPFQHTQTYGVRDSTAELQQTGKADDGCTPGMVN
jgi:signal transduction histidine kinase